MKSLIEYIGEARKDQSFEPSPVGGFGDDYTWSFIPNLYHDIVAALVKLKLVKHYNVGDEAFKNLGYIKVDVYVDKKEVYSFPLSTPLDEWRPDLFEVLKKHPKQDDFSTWQLSYSTENNQIVDNTFKVLIKVDRKEVEKRRKEAEERFAIKSEILTKAYRRGEYMGD